MEEVLNSSVTRNRRGIVAVALVGVISLTAVACAPADEGKGEDASSGATQSQAATPSGKASAAPSETAKPAEAQKPVSKIENAGAGFEAGETVESADGKGSFTQLKAVEGNPMLEDKFSGSLPSGWTQSDLAKSRQYAADFALNKLIDNPSVGAGQGEKNVNAFKNSIRGDLDPKYEQDVLSGITTDNTIVSLVTYYDENPSDAPEGFHYVSDAKNRIVNVAPELEESYNDQGLGVTYNYIIRYDTRAEDLAGNTYLAPLNDKIRVTLSKSSNGSIRVGGFGVEGQWLPPIKQ